MKKILLVFFILVLNIQFVIAYDFEINGIYYNITSVTDKTIEVTCRPDENQNYYGDIIIPSLVSYNNIDFTVTCIGERAFTYFGRDSLNSITIPASIREIKKEAFMVYQGRTNHLKVFITDLSAWCKIDFAEDQHSGLRTNPIASNSSLFLNGVLVDNLIIPSDITEIKPRSFHCYDRLRSVKLHSNVQSVGESAFYRCKNLSTFDASESSLNYIGVYAFRESSLENILLNEGLLKIDLFSFQYLDNLQYITLPSSILEIERSSFTGCKNLKEIVLPEKLSIVENSIFEGCTSLESVTIGDKVKSIEENAFEGCSSLSSVYCKSLVPPSVKSNSFTNGPKLFANLYVPSWSIESYKSAEGWKEFSNIISYDFGPCPHSSLTYYPTKSATCTENGNIEYWKCDFCGKIFSDSEAKNEISIESAIIIASHNFNNAPTWVWFEVSSAKAIFTCSNNDATHEENATISSSVKENATCEENGITIYKAIVMYNGIEYSDTKEMHDINAIGHIYGEVIWNWSEDGKAASAKIVCLHDNNHQIESEAIITSSVKKEATETTKGITTYTATVCLNGTEYTSSKDVEDIPFKVISVSGIALSQSSSTLEVGESFTLTATIDPSNASDKSVSWSSNGTNVATVDSNGKVTAVSAGTATITATSNDGSGVSASCAVTVKDKVIAVSGIALSQSTATLEVGESFTLTATIDPSNASDKSVSWSSNDTNVATVDSNGKVTAVSAGTATITATANAGSGISASCAVTVNNADEREIVKFEDQVFEKYCIDNFDTNNDGKIQTEEAEAVDRIVCNSMGISSLSGINHFKNLTVLECGDNEIKELHPNKNHLLKTLNCSDNELYELEVGDCTRLEILDCSKNYLSNLVLSSNTNLLYLDISVNRFSEINLSNNINLEELQCANNKITTLDISDNEKLSELGCLDNPLETLYLLSTQVFTEFKVPESTAIIYKDYEKYGISIEDPIFKKYCIDNFDTNNDGKLQAEEAEVVDRIICNGMGISSLSGIEYFKNLSVLECSDNEIKELHPNNNPNLKTLICSDNELYDLEVGDCTLLEILDCSKNYISKLALSSNINLQYLDISVNRFSEINLSNNTNLEKLQCANNKIKNLDVSYNEKMSELGCLENPLEILYILSTQVFTEFRVPESTKVIYKDTGETGISNVLENYSTIDTFVGLDGKIRTQIIKGLNIIKTNDGKTKKVIVK